MSGLQLVQTLNSTPFMFLWLFHSSSWDLPFLRKGLGVIKAVRARTGGSRPLSSQNRRAAACPELLERGEERERVGHRSKTPRCHRGQAASPASRYAGGQGWICATCVLGQSEAQRHPLCSLAFPPPYGHGCSPIPAGILLETEAGWCGVGGFSHGDKELCNARVGESRGMPCVSEVAPAALRVLW